MIVPRCLDGTTDWEWLDAIASAQLSPTGGSTPNTKAAAALGDRGRLIAACVNEVRSCNRIMDSAREQIAEAATTKRATVRFMRDLLSAKEIGAALGLHEQTVYALLRDSD